jgi:exodeoxyribonuclease VII large subunit
LSPQATLQRGYAILTDSKGNTVDRVSATAKARKLSAQLADGRLGLTVASIEKKDDA